MPTQFPKPTFLHRRSSSLAKAAGVYLIAVILAAGALLSEAMLRGITAHPVALIGVCAVLISALIGGPIPGWICLALTAAGLWFVSLDRISAHAYGFESELVIWVAYVAFGAVLIEVIRRLQSEKRKLLQHDQRLRLARRAARIWFWGWDLKQNTVRWSRESGLNDQEEIRELPLESYVNVRVHPDDRQMVQTALFEAASLNQRFELEYRILDQRGEIHWLSAKGKLFVEDGSAMMLGMASEVTLQKQADEVRSHFHAVLGSLTEGVCYVNTVGEIQYMNAAAERMLGYSSEQVRGKQLHALIHAGCSANDGNSCCLTAAIQAGHPCNVQEETLTTGAGEKLTTEYTVAPVISDQLTLGAVMMFRDISERKRAEATLRASEKMAATGRIAATISHELRNPLDSVMQLLYLIRQSGKLEGAELQRLDLVDQELRRMNEVAQQTLALHRQSPSKVPVNVAKLIDGVTLLYGKKILAQKIRLEKRIDWSGEIPGFPAELRQVFTNLIVNAVEAMPSGGRLRIHIRHAREPAGPGRTGVLVALLDSGAGISAKTKRQLFQPFFTTKGEKGSGVGLWASQGIVQRHGGRIRVHSDDRLGRSYTCFAVFLPGDLPESRQELRADRSQNQRAANPSPEQPTAA